MTRRALVIGGSGHVGAAALRELARAGATGAFTWSRAAERAAALAEELPFRAHRVDLGDAGALRRLFADLERTGELPDVVVHCAVVTGARSLEQITDAAWDAMQAVNVRSAFAACQELAARPSEAARDVVLTAALDGIHPVPGPASFAASQAARLGLVRALSKELGPRRIRINLVTLGVLDGGLSADLPAEHAAEFRKWAALGRTGTAAEAARAIRWLALENRYMTGAVVPITGGI